VNLLSASGLSGHVIELARTDPRHLSSSLTARPSAPAAGPEEGFGRALAAALGQVNDLQTRSMAMAQAMITDPDSVDIHDVTIALAEANLSLSMTKAIMDRAVRAYQEIMNVR
jgi:flagellar hook-basal body complex protein FliE